VPKDGLVRQLIAYSLLALLLIFLDFVGIIRPVKQLTEIPIVAGKTVLYSLRQSGINTFAYLTAWQIKDEELQRLREDNYRLSTISAQLAILAAQNSTLKTQLAAKIVAEKQLVLVRVIGQTTQSLTVSAGSTSGLREGQTVVVGDNLVGRVVAVTAHQAVVRLPTFDGEKISVSTRDAVDGLRKSSGIVTSVGGVLMLDKVVLSESLDVNDLVMTDGEGFIPDLIVGNIAEVIVQGTKLFKTARVEPIVDYSRLEWVFVVLN
jgi:rod shape-determining protein MreC